MRLGPFCALCKLYTQRLRLTADPLWYACDHCATAFSVEAVEADPRSYAVVVDT